jgi:hypothetical protein
MADEIPVTPPQDSKQENDALEVPTKVDHAIRWGLVVLGIVLASLGALYPEESAMPSWVRPVLVIGGIVVSTFKGFGFNAIPMVKKAIGK